MDSSRIAALGSPKPPTIASRRPMLSSQRSLSALSINTNTTHEDMMRRNSSTTTTKRRLQTPSTVPPLPTSASMTMSPEELSSKIADSFQQFSSMLSQLSNNKPNTIATPVTPPSLSNDNFQISPKPIQRPNLLNSPPLSSSKLPGTITQTRKEIRPCSQPAIVNAATVAFAAAAAAAASSVVIQPKVPSSKKRLPKKVIEKNKEEEDVDTEEYNRYAIDFQNALDYITATSVINEGNTKLRRRLIAKWLTRAASIGDLETIQVMLNRIHDIDMNCTDDETGLTSLMYASYFGKVQCLDLLLNHASIRINQQDKKGWTALMWAIHSDQIEIVSKLLSKGANKTLKTESGKTVYSFPTTLAVKNILGTPPIVQTKKKEKVNNKKSTSPVVAAGGEVDYFYQTSVDGYSHFLVNHTPTTIDPRKKSAPATNNNGTRQLSPPDFSQLTKFITTPQQHQRNKESLNTVSTNETITKEEEEEDIKRWETSIKSSNTFLWDQCLPDQMFVFSQEDLGFILDQALTTTEIKSLMNKSQLSNELWQPANIIFLSTRFAYYCSSRELLNLLLKTVAIKLAKIIKNVYRDTQSLSYWIANMCQLSSYLKKDPGLSISTYEAQETLSELISEAYAFFVTESQKKLEKILDASMLDYESIQEMEQVDFVDDWQRFFRRSSSSYGGRKSIDTLSSIEKKSSMDFSSCTSSFTMDSTCISNSTLSSPVPITSSSSSFSPQSITKLLDQIQSSLQAYYVPPAIVIQAMAQFFHYLSCELFNRVLTYKKYLCRSKALQLRMNLSGIEEWVRIHHLPSSLYMAFEPLNQLLQLLQCLSQMNDTIIFRSTVQTFDKLNPLQVKRCVQNYRYEVSEPKLSESIEKLANQMALDHQQQQQQQGSKRNSQPIIQKRISIDSINNNRPASISSLNCLLTATTNKKRLSSEELMSINSSLVQQLDDDIEDEKRNSKYLLPFSIPVTTALLQGWTDEKQKKSIHQSTINNYSEAIYQEIKLKKQEQFNLLDKIYPSISEEWVYNLDKRLNRT